MLPLHGLRDFAHINSDSVSLPWTTCSDTNLGAVAAAGGVSTMVWCHRCSLEVPEPASSHLHPQRREKTNEIITTSKISSSFSSLEVSLEPKHLSVTHSAGSWMQEAFCRLPVSHLHFPDGKSSVLPRGIVLHQLAPFCRHEGLLIFSFCLLSSGRVNNWVIARWIYSWVTLEHELWKTASENKFLLCFTTIKHNKMTGT